MHPFSDQFQAADDQISMGYAILPEGERFTVEDESAHFSKRFGVAAKRFVMRARKMPPS